jgi:hypothetical protein
LQINEPHASRGTRADRADENVERQIVALFGQRCLAARLALLLDDLARALLLDDLADDLHTVDP